MLAKVRIAISAVMMVLLSVVTARAITVTASPNPAQVGQNVAVGITTNNFTAAGCPMTVNFGDGSPPLAMSSWVTGCPTGATAPCLQTVNHSFAASGVFPVTATVTGICTSVVPPLSATVNVSILATQPPAITALPSTLSVPRDTTGSGVITYRASGGGSTTLTSGGGSFSIGGEVIGLNPVPLSVRVVNGSGQGTEALTLPARLSEIALQRGVNNYTYTRTFTGATTAAVGAPVTLTTSVRVNITTEAAASFSIRRLELYFTNDKRGETTVPRNEPGLRAAAAISYTGSGLLQGHWEIDGRIIGQVFQHLTFGDTLTLEMPPGVTLPTFDPGTHTVQFIIENPQVTFQLPLLIYFVTPDEAAGQLKLVLPKTDDTIPYAPARFEWEGISAAKIYLVRFFRKPEDVQVFSAYSTTPFYLLQETALRGYFAPGRTYAWDVRALDEKGNTIATSPQAAFSFREQGAFVKGHIIVALADGAGEPAAGEIAAAHGLRLIESIPLPSINSVIALLDAGDADIFPLIEAIGKDRRVRSAQPDFIFSVNADSLREIRNSGDLLRIERLHKSARGKGTKVAVIDTGVDTEHAELKQRVSFFRNYVRGERYSAEQHGTAVAGLIAADGREYSGVAPAAELLALRACRQVSADRAEGECTSEGLARALDAAIARKAQVINMSFGSGARDPLLVRLIDQAADSGILLVAPVGNRPDASDLPFPASHPAVIAVAGFDERQKPWPNPTLCAKAAVAAPAVNLLTTTPGNRHNFLTGTSFSSALVSGLLVLALERDRGLTRRHLPIYANDFCRWQEALLKIPLCGKK